ncbi:MULTISPECIES: alkaline phosphatase [unclassified Staphylococcus]|uniref:alkaline phosphatase n=1 Tax=unclassified Staphylococcus TaxID=91994 RepID=UPI0021D156C9|nr:MULTISPECIES: alkaline phosphatase [unclassified Staphylococcus]UXR76155.1 alkaline phosphatase [Staphylococcus sp. IVB6233]UXR80352.1 alkaline phosphatase [Staphylococcus sp. IVB6218]
MKLRSTLSHIMIASSLVSASIVGAAPEAQANTQQKDQVQVYGDKENPKNIIFLVGDGMGPSYQTAYRYFADNPDTEEMEETAFDDYLVGSQRTYSADEKDNVTDSAAAGTAISSGHKTYNGAIGVDANKQKVETVLERAKSIGKSTGLVTTAELTDATPAAYASHVADRGQKNDIAKQFYDQRIQGEHKVDVLLGGGAKYFGKENGNLDKQFEKDGYDVVTNKESLAESDSEQVLGIFADENIPLQIDAPDDDPSLAEMQKSALDRLSKDGDGFFLMVEGASIDKQGHTHDVTGVMSEMSGFEKAFEDAMAYAKSNPDTLVVATADHSTGGLSVGKDGEYAWDAEPIRNMKHSAQWMTEQIAAGESIEDTVKAGYGFDVDTKAIEKMKQAADRLSKLDKKKDEEEYEQQYQALQDAIQQPINDASKTGWTSSGHTGVDTNTYAYGPGAEAFRGNMNNVENAQHIFSFYEKES